MSINLAILSYQDYLLEALNLLKDEFDIELVYSTTLTKNHYKRVINLHPNCIVHDAYEAMMGKLPETKFEKVCCPKILEKIQKYEIVAISMLSRIEYKDGSLTLDKRRVLFKRIAGFWQNLILSKNISLLIFEEEPHVFSEYIAYIVAKAMKINVIFFSRIFEGNKLLVFDSIEKYSRPLELNLNNKNKQAKIKEEINKAWSIFKDTHKKSEAFHLYDHDFLFKNKQFISSNFRRLLKPFKLTIQILKRIFLFLTFNRFENKLFIRHGISDFKPDKNGHYNEVSYIKFLIYKSTSIFKAILMKIFYSKISSKNIKSKKYVFFTLQFQPERTTLPMGGLFEDFGYLCDLIIECLPKDCNLVIKDHKSQYYYKYIKGGFRTRTYKQFKSWHQNPRMEIASIDADTFEIIDNAIALITITGSTGVEAIAREKPVLVFGAPNYRFHQSLIQIESKKQLKEVLVNISDNNDNNDKNNDKNNELFFKFIAKNTLISYAGGKNRHVRLKIPENENYLAYSIYLKNILKKLYSLKK